MTTWLVKARVLRIFGAIMAAVMVTLVPANAKPKAEKAEELIVKAADTVTYFANDSAYETLWGAADDAKAMVIIPRSLRGGFIVGASGGNAVMLARNPDGSWSEPTFFTIGSLSFGFQAGVEGSETVLLGAKDLFLIKRDSSLRFPNRDIPTE